MTAWIAAINSSGGAFFTRNPLAPARRASKTYSSSSNVVRMMIRGATAAGAHGSRQPGLVLEQSPRSVETVHDGHLDVHQDDVRVTPADDLQRLRAVRGLPDHLDVRLRLEDPAEADADQLLVIDQDDPDRRDHP